MQIQPQWAPPEGFFHLKKKQVRMIHFQGIMLETYCISVKYSLVYFNVENIGKLCYCSQLRSDENVLNEI